jgi:hypothetical protein
MRSKTPIRLQRINRLYKALWGPYSLGAYRQRSPFLITMIVNARHAVRDRKTWPDACEVVVLQPKQIGHGRVFLP